MAYPRGSVHIGMPHNRIFNMYAFKAAAAVTLSADVARGDYILNLVAGHGAIAGHTILIRELNHQYQGRVVSVSTDALTMDTPFGYPYTTGADANRGIVNMNVDGSSTKQEFYVTAPPTAGVDVHRHIIVIEDQTAMDTALFGGITALTKGVVIAARDSDGELIQVQQAIRSNGEWAERAYDVTYDSKAPSGFFGLRVRRSWGGLDKSGAVPHMSGGLTDAMKIVVIVQDLLTSLDSFRIIFQGHYVEER